MLEAKRVFITGGAGFIGSNRETAIAKNRIALFDNFSRNAAQRISGRELASISRGGLKIYRSSVLDSEALTAAIEDFDPTHIIHCAAVAGIDTVVKKPVDTLEINMLGTVNLLRAAQLSASAIERVVRFDQRDFWPAGVQFERTVVGRYRRSVKALDLCGIEAGERAFDPGLSPPARPAYRGIASPFNVLGPGQVGEGIVYLYPARAAQPDNPDPWHRYPDPRVVLHRRHGRRHLHALTHPNAPGKAFNIGIHAR
jgi:nucleoside-diphosphate-sugar epimerase